MIQNDFIAQTAKDYDLPYETVENLYQRKSKDLALFYARFYADLEQIIQARAAADIKKA